MADAPNDELPGIKEDAEKAAMEVHLTEIKRVLREGQAKVEFGIAFGGPTGSVQTAQVWERKTLDKRYGGQTTKWVKVGPFITTKEGTRASLLLFLSHLATKED